VYVGTMGKGLDCTIGVDFSKYLFRVVVLRLPEDGVGVKIIIRT
jgi:hypothetical protein